MKAKFTWRETELGYTLLGFTDVLQKVELPVEYVSSPGPKYWYMPPVVINRVAYGDYIAYYPDYTEKTLKVGAVLSPGDWGRITKLLQDAGKRLTRIKKMVEDGQEFVIQV